MSLFVEGYELHATTWNILPLTSLVIALWHTTIDCVKSVITLDIDCNCSCSFRMSSRRSLAVLEASSVDDGFLWLFRFRSTLTSGELSLDNTLEKGTSAGCVLSLIFFEGEPLLAARGTNRKRPSTSLEPAFSSKIQPSGDLSQCLPSPPKSLDVMKRMVPYQSTQNKDQHSYPLAR